MTTMRSAITSSVRVSSIVTVLAFCLALCGCGKGEIRGRVSGKVTSQGHTVSNGMVFFGNFQKGIHAAAKLSADGSYEVKTLKGVGLPLGTYKVFLSPAPKTSKGAPLDEAPQVEEGSDIPPKYSNPGTSGLTLTVAEGENRFDIAM
jgi:hypothetical protein